MSERSVFLSHPFGPSCPAYAGGPGVKMKVGQTLAAGHSCNSLQIESPNHIGTHFDFPRHFAADGAVATDYPAAFFVHKHVYLGWWDLPPGTLLGPEQLLESLRQRPADPRTTLVLLRLGAACYRHEDQFWQNGPGLGLGLAAALRELLPACTTVGMDSISLSSMAHRETGRIVHREFLTGTKPLLLIEDMDLEPLAGIQPRQVIALPLRIEQGDGAPCTVVAEL